MNDSQWFMGCVVPSDLKQLCTQSCTFAFFSISRILGSESNVLRIFLKCQSEKRNGKFTYGIRAFLKVGRSLLRSIVQYSAISRSQVVSEVSTLVPKGPVTQL